MTWWIVCFGAAILVIVSKWYFSNAISRLQRTLSRQQRETLELKGTLTDARQNLQDQQRLVKIKNIDSDRHRKHIADRQLEIRNLERGKPKDTDG